MNATYKTIEEAIDAFGLNFELEKVQLCTNKGGLKTIPKTMKMGIRRKDTREVIGLVSQTYPETSPMERFGIFQRFADEKILEFVNGGVYANGSRCFIEARLPNSLLINPEVGDIIEKRITFHTSYDGSVSNIVAIRPLRLVCTNGMTRTGQEWESKVRNTKNFPTRIEEIVPVIQAAINEYKKFDEFIVAANDTREFNDEEVHRFIKTVLPATPNDKGKISTLVVNRRLALEEAIHNAIGQTEIAKMNAYKLFQGALAFTTHVEAANVKDPFLYLNFGGGAEVNRRAMMAVGNMLETGSFA